MKEGLEKAFQKAIYEPEAGLSDKVWHAVILREKRIYTIKLWAFSFAGILSLIGIVPAFKMLFTDFAQSGFYEYFSLLFSNGGAISSYWKELSLSLVQALPLTSILLSLTLVFFFFLSVRFAMKQIIKGHLNFAY